MLKDHWNKNRIGTVGFFLSVFLPIVVLLVTFVTKDDFFKSDKFFLFDPNFSILLWIWGITTFLVLVGFVLSVKGIRKEPKVLPEIALVFSVIYLLLLI